MNLAFILQFNVDAKDLGTPSRSATQKATVTIQVTRNTVGPRFAQAVYNVEIDETHSAGTSVFKVTATDTSPVRICDSFERLKKYEVEG